MGIEIPGWLRWVGDLIGEPFPEGDETACRRQADRWRHYADQLESHRDGLSAATRTTLSGFASGELHDTLDGLLKPYGSSIDQIAGQLRQLADAVDNVATEIEFAKEMFIANLAALAATLVALAASAWINWGAPVEAAAAVAGIELVISQGIRAAAAKVASEALARVIAQLVTRALGSAAVNAGISAGLNTGIQGQQMVQGNRHDFDWESWRNDVASGAISGAVMGPILKGAHDFDAGSALGNRAKNFGASFVGNAGGAAAAQQALTGHVNLADALGAGAVFGAVDGVRSPGVHGGGPDTPVLTGDRPGSPLVEPLPATQHQQTPIESSPSVTGRSADVSAARPADVDVPFNLGSQPRDAVPMNPNGLAGAETAAPHPPAPASHTAVTDSPMTGSPSAASPAAAHAASASTGPPAAPAGHAGPSTAGPQAPAARAGVSDAVAAPAARTSDAVAPTGADPHPVRGAAAPAPEVAAQPSHELPREATPSRDVPAPRDAPPPRDPPPPHDTRTAPDAQPARDPQPRRDPASARDDQPPRDGEAPRDAQSAGDAKLSRDSTADTADRSRPAAPESRSARETHADTVRRADSAPRHGKGGAEHGENNPDPLLQRTTADTPPIVAAAVSPETVQFRPTPSDTVRPPGPQGGDRHPAADDPPPRRPEGDTSRGGDDLPSPGPDPAEPTGVGNPANHRNYGPNELAPLEDHAHQTALEQALRNPNGEYQIGADPRTNAYGALVNDGGPAIDGRANNCLDCALAALASFHGDPTVSVPRFLDQQPDGTIDLTSGEASGLDRAQAWLGDGLHLSDQNLSIRQQYAALHREIALLGPGSSALVVSEWHARDAAGNPMYHSDGTPLLDGSHATVIVYPRDAAGPVWWDPQNSLTSDHPPAMLVNESAYLWSTPIAADHFGPAPNPGGRHGAAGDPGTGAGLSGTNLPGSHVSGDAVRDGLGRDPDPAGGQHREPANRAGEADNRLGDRDRHHALEPADKRGGRNLHDSKAVGPTGRESDLPAPMADHPAAHPGGSRDHRLPDDGRLTGTAAGTHAGAQPDHQQADLHSRTDGRPLEGGDVSRPLDESAEPGSVARGSDGDALEGATPASDPDAGDRGRGVASDPDAARAQGVANAALWKRIPPVRPEEVRHHLADTTFGEQRARDNAAWWRQLGGEEQRALIDSYSREIGNAEGIPAWARTEANEHQLSRLHDELQARRDAGEHLNRREVRELRRYNEIREALDDARADAAHLGAEVHVLALDPHAFGGDGRIVVSVGHDPFHAETVSWHVPGMMNSIDTLGGNLRGALNHLKSVQLEDPSSTAASIAWIGYDAPSGKGFWRVAFHGLARDGGAILHSDILAFNASTATGADGESFTGNHVFGHSYGSTTTSYAGQAGQFAGHVRSVTLAGSPGAGPQRHASDFGIGERVFVASSSRDFVTALGGRTPGSLGRLFGRGLGIDPAMAAFGAHRITAEFPQHMDRWDTKGTHTSYYDQDAMLGVRTESLANFGRIATEHFDEVHVEARRTERAWWKWGWRTDEPAQGRPLQLEPTNGEAYSTDRRVWDPHWHSGHPESSDVHGGKGSDPYPHDATHSYAGSLPQEGRCAHDVTDFLAAHYNRQVSLEARPGPSGLPARDLFQAWGSASHFANYAEVGDALLRHGDGSAAILASRWSSDPAQGGHAYVAVNEAGTVHLYRRIGGRFERSGWPPSWGEQAVDATAVGYLDRHGNPIELLDGRPGQLDAAQTVGNVAGGGDAAAPPGLVAHHLPPESPLFAGYQPTDPGPEFTNPDGSLIYPDDSLPSKPYAIPGTVIADARLATGAVLDRFGWPGGGYLSPAGVLFAERALPPDSATKPYFQYQVDDPAALPPGYHIERSLAAPWFHQPGGGTQYRIVAPPGQRPSVQALIDSGFLKPLGER